MSSEQPSTSPSPAGKRARHSARSEDKFVRELGKHMEANDRLQKTYDMNYVWSAMEEEETGEVAKAIPNMIKKGTIQKGLFATKVVPGQQELGLFLKDSTLTYRLLNTSTIDFALSHLEPLVFTQDTLANEAYTRDLKLDDLCFGLGVLVSSKLPLKFLLLRFEKTLVLYLACRYDKLGRRLRAWTIDGQIGYFKVEGTMLVTNVSLPTGAHQLARRSRCWALQTIGSSWATRP